MTVDPALVVKPLAVPAAAAPEPIVEALATREERRRSYRAATQRVAEAQAGLSEADRLDLIAVADARDRGEDDPLPVNREQARRAVEAARNDEQVESLRFSRAHDALVEAVARHAQAWAQAASQARAKADQRALKALAQLRAAEDERAELRRVAAGLDRLSAGESLDRVSRKSGALIAVATAVPDARNEGRQLTVAELVSAIEAYVQSTTE